jgi:hypothetical protein
MSKVRMSLGMTEDAQFKVEQESLDDDGSHFDPVVYSRKDSLNLAAGLLVQRIMPTWNGSEVQIAVVDDQIVISKVPPKESA